ncbi:hypothetical protein BCR41DRAFT_375527 [Lobosporangium transversale]|uniref:Uncharacterized protein n=1 Tax=Lobosporangium transversale TaxID=64571 RepID=A0A1Y2G8J7_9FUNG|nr:hypothetical protein BCR41DRAFT_375527 [Lobosporangium transversale]ORY98443.1 hypothetical protein BCR41DRAFT_375527 [Lobosporangium transversale]|eukprot:XP_021875814.1 hypothetical protein BCR41DRAFT_375527 [Lobosporangium transversale]
MEVQGTRLFFTLQNFRSFFSLFLQHWERLRGSYYRKNPIHPCSYIFLQPIAKKHSLSFPEFDSICSTVFKPDVITFEDVTKALTNDHHFTFTERLQETLSEREAFCDITWNFIRGAFTLHKIRSNVEISYSSSETV